MSIYFGHISTGGSGPISTPTWEEVTEAGNVAQLTAGQSVLIQNMVADALGLRLKAHASQTAANPMLRIVDSADADLFAIHSMQQSTVSLGAYAGDALNLTVARYGTFVGTYAGSSVTTGVENTAVGYSSGFTTTTGSKNTLVGYAAGYGNTTGAENTFVGYDAGLINTTGGSNTFIGSRSGEGNTTASSNTFVGYRSGLNNSTGDSNSYFGTNTGLANTTGVYGTFVGASAGQANTTGSWNTFVGFQAAYANTTGFFNTFVGFQSGYTNTSGANNVFIGYQAGKANTTADNNTFVGHLSGLQNITAYGGAFFGTQAGSANTTGINSTYIGFQAGVNNTTGQSNVYVGTSSGATGTTASDGTMLGYRAGFAITTGNANILVGFQAGDNLTTGSSNIVIGYAIDAPLATSANVLTIGNLIFGTGVDGTGTTLSTGNVGIGIVTPTSKLHVVGTAYLDGAATTTNDFTVTKANSALVLTVPAGDVWHVRNNAGTFELRNATEARSLVKVNDDFTVSNLDVYGNHGDQSVNYERFRVQMIGAGYAQIRSEAAGTGTARGVMINAGGTNVASFETNGTTTLYGALDHDGATVGFYGVAPVVRSTGWAVTGTSVDKTLDKATTSVGELYDVVGTLINELKNTGLIGA